MRKMKQANRAASYLKTALLTSCSLGLNAMFSPAFAQTNPSHPGDMPNAEAQGGIQDIVVTARKRAETAQTTPLAITALSAEHLDQYAINSLEQVAATTPQLQISRAVSGSGANISLRGIGSSFSSVGIEQSAAIIVDGVYFGSGRALNDGLFDSSRIEILKGPQALFFGKNATAAAISVTTNDPTDKFSAMARVGYEFGAKNLSGEGYVSGALSETLSARLAVRYSNMFGGYYRNGAQPSTYTTFDAATFTSSSVMGRPSDYWGPQEKQGLGRLTLKWTPTERLTARLKVYGNTTKANDSAWNAVPICAGATMQLAPTQSCNNDFIRYAENPPAVIGSQLLAGNGTLGNKYWSYGATAIVDYTLDNVDITSVSNYNKFKNTSSPSYHGESPFNGGGGGGWGTEITASRAVSSEIRLLTKFDSPINLMIGAYYQDTHFTFNADDAFGGVRNSADPKHDYITVIKNSFTNGKTLAAFGQVTWKITPELELDAGIRYTHETKDSFFIQPYANPLFVPGFYLPNVPVTANQTWNNWSPDITFKWQPHSNIMVYGGYKTGYKSGGFSNSTIYNGNTPPGGLEFEPETVKGFEGGIKTTLFDNQFRFNVGLYRYQYNDLQIDFFNSAIVALVTTNAGAAVTKGIEIETQWSPRSIPSFDIHGTLNYNRARYKDYQGPCWTGQTPALGCNVTGPGGVPFQNLSGKPTANAPEWTASFGFAYNFPIQDGLEARVSADGRYSDRYNFTSVYDPIGFQKAYIVVDAMASVATSDARWEFALIAKNLTNKRYIGTSWEITNSPAAPNKVDLIGFGNIPRTVEARITWKY